MNPIELTISDRMTRGDLVDKIRSGSIKLPECEASTLIGIKYVRNNNMFAIPIVSKMSDNPDEHYSQDINSDNVINAVMGDFQSLDLTDMPTEAMLVDKEVISFTYAIFSVDKRQYNM